MNRRIARSVVSIRQTFGLPPSGAAAPPPRSRTCADERDPPRTSPGCRQRGTSSMAGPPRWYAALALRAVNNPHCRPAKDATHEDQPQWSITPGRKTATPPPALAATTTPALRSLGRAWCRIQPNAGAADTGRLLTATGAIPLARWDGPDVSGFVRKQQHDDGRHATAGTSAWCPDIIRCRRRLSTASLPRRSSRCR